MFLAISCAQSNNCAQDLRMRDAKLLDQAQKWVAQKNTLDSSTFWKQMELLRADEQQLFKDVQSCHFEDQAAYNYWHRSRMKFPGIIEQTFRNR